MNFPQVLINAVADGPTLTAAAAASCLPTAAKLAIPANWWAVGRMLRIEASGRISSVITTPGTARYDLRYGSTVIFDSQAILLDTAAAHTTVGWKLEVWLTCRAIGASANVFGYGSWECEDILGVPATAPKGVLRAVLPWNTTPAVGANFDSTAAQSLDMFFTQTVATGSMTLHQYKVTAEDPVGGQGLML